MGTEELHDVVAPAEQEWTKATVLGWLVQIGDTVREGDPLVEIETEKIAVEIAAPASGVLAEIIAAPDAEVEPGSLLGRLSADAAAARPEPAEPATRAETGDLTPGPAAEPSADALETRLSPSVRRLVREHKLDPKRIQERIQGTGKGQRLTRRDVEAYLANAAPSPDADKGAAPAAPAASAPGASQRIPHDAMRRRIAEHMTRSVATAPHVTAVFEADFSNVLAHRKATQSEYAARGVKLTLTTYLVAACVRAMTAVPTINSRWYDDAIEVFSDVNVGVGVALADQGLIVPVVHRAQRLSHFEIAERLQAVTENARSGTLSPKDVQGGTFTLSNHGTSGSLVATPIIINQPQSAILGVGKLEKRVVVRNVDGQDTIQIRPLAYVSLTIDHRVIDGAQTNAWLTEFVRTIEQWPLDRNLSDDGS